MPDNKIKIYGTLKAQTEDEIVATTKDIFHQTTKTPDGAYLDDFLDTLETEVANIDTATDKDIDHLFSDVVKGDIIKFDAFGNGVKQRFRVLNNVSNRVFEVVSLANNLQGYFNTSDVQVVFPNNEKGQQYLNSNLDTYLNDTYFNSLSSNIKSAIVTKNIKQSLYKVGIGQSSTADFNLTLLDLDKRSYTKRSEITIGERKIYALDVSEVAEYLNFKDHNLYSGKIINEMFFETELTQNYMILLRTAFADYTDRVCQINGINSYINDGGWSDSRYIRPAFQIDLSKITYEVEE